MREFEIIFNTKAEQNKKVKIIAERMTDASAVLDATCGWWELVRIDDKRI